MKQFSKTELYHIERILTDECTQTPHDVKSALERALKRIPYRVTLSYLRGKWYHLRDKLNTNSTSTQSIEKTSVMVRNRSKSTTKPKPRVEKTSRIEYVKSMFTNLSKEDKQSILIHVISNL